MRKVAIIISGGVVQDVVSNTELEVEVIDIDDLKDADEDVDQRIEEVTTRLPNHVY